ncbi:MAG: SDR family oxidoreductase [Alphaproteobacteria bacterium]
MIIGLGYVGEALAVDLNSKGWKIRGTTRSPEKADRLRVLGIETWADTHDPHFQEALHEATHMLISIPPIGEFEPEENSQKNKSYFKEQPFFSPLSLCASKKNTSPLLWLGYLSSTAVYGDHEGAWVDEETVPHPNTPEGMRRLYIENSLQRYMTPFPVHIFRLAGIYGPGRNVLEAILEGKAKRIFKKDVVFSRIHLNDILQVLKVSMVKNSGKRVNISNCIYNVADDEPSATASLVEYGCKLLKHPSLPLLSPEEANLSAMGKSFYRSSKKILNKKIKREMDIHLMFPNYREGLNMLSKKFQS